MRDERSREERELDRRRARWRAGLDPDGSEAQVLLTLLGFTIAIAALTILVIMFLLPHNSTPSAGTHAITADEIESVVYDRSAEVGR